MSAPLYGLVLAGGRSSRMREDKAALPYQGQAQLARAMELIAPLVARAFVSVRADQTDDPLRARFAQIVDGHRDMGPIAGIMAAQEQYSQVGWLVLACDLPFVDAETLARLVRERDPSQLASAYRSRHDGLPEPLCAIYEPASHAAIAAYVAAGGRCPRKFLTQVSAHLIEASNPDALENINTPEEYGAALKMRPIRVQYYAVLREQAGRSEETIHTTAATPRQLYDSLRQRYGFALPPQMLRVAINGEFGDWSQLLKSADAVVFIPPVAGG